MRKNKSRREIVPKEFATLETAADFWDKHDVADYWKDTKGVKVDVKVPPTPVIFRLKKRLLSSLQK